MTKIETNLLPLGTARFDPEAGRLFNASGEIIPLSSIAAKVLSVLVSREGDEVPMAALIAADPRNADASDESLVQAIAEIRLAIGDQARTVIRPIPGVGYRLSVTPKQPPKRPRNMLKIFGLAIALLPVVAILAQLLLWAL